LWPAYGCAGCVKCSHGDLAVRFFGCALVVHPACPGWAAWCSLAVDQMASDRPSVVAGMVGTCGSSIAVVSGAAPSQIPSGVSHLLPGSCRAGALGEGVRTCNPQRTNAGSTLQCSSAPYCSLLRSGDRSSRGTRVPATGSSLPTEQHMPMAQALSVTSPLGARTAAFTARSQRGALPPALHPCRNAPVHRPLPVADRQLSAAGRRSTVGTACGSMLRGRVGQRRVARLFDTTRPAAGRREGSSRRSWGGWC